MPSIELIDVNETNVANEGFFCRMSKMKTEGNRKKLEWLNARFAEGLKIKMFKLPQRGFIEYIPGEYAWRTVNAKAYMFIHCLWVAGQRQIRSKVIELKTAEEVRALSPSPYGVFNAVLDGKLLSHHYLPEKDFLDRLAMTKYA